MPSLYLAIGGVEKYSCSTLSASLQPGTPSPRMFTCPTLETVIASRRIRHATRTGALRYRTRVKLSHRTVAPFLSYADLIVLLRPEMGCTPPSHNAYEAASGDHPWPPASCLRTGGVWTHSGGWSMSRISVIAPYL